MLQRWVCSLLLGTSAYFLSATVQAQCTKDVDCKGDRICPAGVCVAPSPALSAPAVMIAQPVESAASPPPVVQYRRHSKGMMITGIVMTSLGAMSLLTGGALAITSAACDASKDRGCDDFGTAATFSALGGLLVGGTGLPLLIIGSRKEPVQQARVVMTPWLGPTSGGMQLRFTL